MDKVFYASFSPWEVFRKLREIPSRERKREDAGAYISGDTNKNLN
jgi:hypothetical protein